VGVFVLGASVAGGDELVLNEEYCLAAPRQGSRSRGRMSRSQAWWVHSRDSETEEICRPVRGVMRRDSARRYVRAIPAPTRNEVCRFAIFGLWVWYVEEGWFSSIEMTCRPCNRG
jgi:hypothetical protein